MSTLKAGAALTVMSNDASALKPSLPTAEASRCTIVPSGGAVAPVEGSAASSAMYAVAVRLWPGGRLPMPRPTFAPAE